MAGASTVGGYYGIASGVAGSIGYVLVLALDDALDAAEEVVGGFDGGGIFIILLLKEQGSLFIFALLKIKTLFLNLM